jgi:hypothetical protein
MESLLALPLVSRCTPGSLPLVSRFDGQTHQKKNRPLAPEAGTVARMPMSKKELDAFRRTIVRGPYKSPLFWWLVEQYDELTTEDAASRQDWRRHCATMARDGVVDAKGKPPNPDAARKAWQVVRREVAAGRAKRPLSETNLGARSRSRADWSPPMVRAASPTAGIGTRLEHNIHLERQPPPRVDPVPATLQPTNTTERSPLDDLPPEAKAKIDRLRQAFAETDRKRFGRF